MVKTEREKEVEEKARLHLKKLEERLRYYKKVVIDSNNAIIIQDFNGKIKAWNKGAEKIYGFTEEEMLGQNITKIISKEYRAEARKNIKLIRKGKPSFLINQIRKTKDNKRVFVKITYSPIYEKEELIEIATTEEDITQLKNTIEDLKKSEVELKELFNNMDESVAIYDIKNKGRDVIIKDFNKPAERLEKVKKEDIIGKKVDKVFPGVKEFGLYKIFEKVWRTGKSIHHPISFYKDKYHQGWRDNFVFKLPHDGIVSIYSDVTEKKEIEKRLKEAEEKYRNISEKANDGIVIIQNGIIRYGNQALAKMRGELLKNIINHKFLEYVAPEEVGKIKGYYEKRLKGEKIPSKYETVLLRKNRERIYVELNAEVIQYEGKPADLAVIRDITERKKSQEKKYQLLVESIKQGLYITQNGKFIEVNKGMENIFGYSKEELLRMNAWDLAKPEIKEKVKENFFAKIKRNDYSSVIVECQKKNKTPLLAEISMNKLNEGIRFSGFVTDITEKIKIREAEEKYKILYESSADAIMTLEPPSWRFTSGNAMAIKVFKAKNEKHFISRAPWEYSPKYQPDGQPSSEKAKEMIMEAMEKGSNFFEWTHKKYKGENFPATVLLTRVKIGEKSFLQATVRDTTEQKRMEAKAKESEIMKTEFLSAISHELRTPITPIKSQVQRMLSTELNKEEETRSLEIVLRNTIRMDRLIQDLLEVTRIRAGKFNILKKKENLNEIIEETITDLNSLAKEKGTIITFDKGEIPEISIDRGRIIEVLINLIDNAIKYGNGKILVETKKENGNVLIKVEDNGQGIPKSEIGKIFTPFYRGGRIEAQKYEGTGLGLSICKGIVEAHGGTIWFNSEIGKGTKFFVKLPIK